jgi:hypothetical protein
MVWGVEDLMLLRATTRGEGRVAATKKPFRKPERLDNRLFEKLSGGCAFVFDFGYLRILFHAFDAVVAARFGGVLLAGSDYLAVGGLQVEHKFAACCFFLLVTRVFGAIALHAVDAIETAFLAFVTFAAEDCFTIAGGETEIVFAIFAGVHFEFGMFRHWGYRLSVVKIALAYKQGVKPFQKPPTTFPLFSGSGLQKTAHLIILIAQY